MPELGLISFSLVTANIYGVGMSTENCVLSLILVTANIRMRDYLDNSVVEAYAALKSLTKSTNREKRI